MIPILFYSEATAFNSNGIGRLTDCISCIVTEERNGIYECEFSYPVSGIRYSEIKEGRLIVCTHDDKRDLQPFRIYRRSAPINGIVTFNARHISYDLRTTILRPYTANSIANAFAGFSTYAMTENKFTFWTDKATTANFKVTAPVSVKAVLGGTEGSILDVFGGGEYEFDKMTVRLYQNRGTDSGVTIRYGKNMTDITHEVDTGDMYNSVVPYWLDSSSGDVVYGGVVGGHVSASDRETWTDENRATMTDESNHVLEFDYGRVITATMDLSSSFGEGVKPTKAQLETKAEQKLNSGDTYLPNENIKVNFVQLWQTSEYEDVAVLQRLSLCDTVTVIYPALGVSSVKRKVIKVVYNTLLNRYDSMELGKAKTSFAETVTGRIVDEVIPQTVDVMKAAIDHATQLITGGMGGHVVFEMDADGKPQEIYIMDTENVNTSVNVLRINLNGIGFSRHGINGPYETAWTIDGHFVADFITAGTLDANLIRAGTIRSVAGKSFWDLVAGDLVIAGNRAEFTIGAQPFLDYSDMLQKIFWSTVEHMHFAFQNSNGTIAQIRAWLAGEDTWAQTASRARRVVYLFPSADNIDSVTENTVHYDLEEIIAYGQSTTPAQQVPFYSITMLCSDSVGNGATMLMATGGGYFGKGSANYISPSKINPTNAGGWHVKVDGDGIDILGNAAVFKITGANELKNTNATLYWNGKAIQIASTSSRRYKKYINDLKAEALDPHKLLELPVRQFKYKVAVPLQYDDTEDQLIPGFIAEEVDEIYPAATIHHPENGEIESWDERRIIPGMLALIQEQQKTIEALTERIERLEAIINADTRPAD